MSKRLPTSVDTILPTATQVQLTVGVGLPIPIAPFLEVCALKPFLRPFWPLAIAEAEACSRLQHAAQYAQWE